MYAPAADRRLRRSIPLAYSRACFNTRLGQGWHYQGPRSLSAVVVGVIEDYGYDNDVMDAYVDVYHHDATRLQFAHGGDAGVTNLQKLLRERFDVLLEHEAVVNTMTRKLGLQTQIRVPCAGCARWPTANGNYRAARNWRRCKGDMACRPRRRLNHLSIRRYAPTRYQLHGDGCCLMKVCSRSRFKRPALAGYRAYLTASIY